MKRFVLLSMLGLLLVNCANQELEDLSKDIENTASESNFISVRIVSTDASGTRADEYTPEEGEVYKDGTVSESYVKDVLLFFFKENGDPASVYKNATGYQSYYHWENIDDSEVGDNTGKGETVEKEISKIISLTIPRQGDEAVLPTQLLAIVNPTTAFMDNLKKKEMADLTLKNLEAEIDDYEEGLKRGENAEGWNDQTDENKGCFVMTNSVYCDKENKLVETTALKKENFFTTEADAENAESNKGIVTIYVERILARIDLKIGINNDNNIDSKDADGNVKEHLYYVGNNSLIEVQETNEGSTKTTVTDQNLYVRLLGWNVFDTPSKSYLIKKINKNWKDDLFYTEFETGFAWNSWNYKRSYWAINPKKSSGWEYKSGSFLLGKDFEDGDLTGTDSKKSKWSEATYYKIPVEEGSYTTAYFQENAAPDSDDSNETSSDNISGAPIKPSKVIIAAQLVDKEGKALELTKWGGQYYNSLEGLKIYLCYNTALNKLKYLTESKNDQGNTVYTYNRIKPKDLDIVESEGTTLLTVKIKEEVTKEAIGWYTGTTLGDLSKIELGEDGINGYISTDGYVGKNNVKLWKNGYTYFYFTIRHLGNEKSPAYYGVVRNHIYEANIRSIKGLGIAVSDPYEPIEVETDEEAGVLNAEVKILSWRVVKQNYDLNW